MPLILFGLQGEYFPQHALSFSFCLDEYSSFVMYLPVVRWLIIVCRVMVIRAPVLAWKFKAVVVLQVTFFIFLKGQ
jgi:hypothetical protein